MISVLEGRKVTVTQHGSQAAGIVDGITKEGFLRLVDSGTVHNITVGDAHLML